MLNSHLNGGKYKEIILNNMVSIDEMPPLKIPSVFDGDIPFVKFSCEADDKTIECGRLWAKGGVLRFEGDADESAKIFFEQVIRHNLEYIMRSNA